jgi:hypothetical protein
VIISYIENGWMKIIKQERTKEQEIGYKEGRKKSSREDERKECRQDRMKEGKKN